jgi:hypothetical protein
LPLHATKTNENFQRSLLAAQIANNDVKKLSSSSSSTKSLSSASVDYDAAARLAFQKQSSSSSSNEDFETFKVKYGRYIESNGNEATYSSGQGEGRGCKREGTEGG